MSSKLVSVDELFWTLITGMLLDGPVRVRLVVPLKEMVLGLQANHVFCFSGTSVFFYVKSQ